MNESHNLEDLDRKYVEEKASTEFAAMLEQSSAEPKQENIWVGQRISGKIQEIRDSCVFVDYGGRSEAFIDLQELKDEAGEIRYQPGDMIEAYVASAEGEVRLTLSLRATTRQALRQAYENEIPVEGRVTGFNTGGLVVNLAGRRAFCPLSHIDTSQNKDLATYAGQTLTFKILEYRDRGRNIVVSHRAHLEAEAARKAQELRDRLSVGVDFEGKVTRLERFGAFVDLGGVEGLVHVSELAHSRVNHPREVVSRGKEVQVRVLELKDLGTDKERISLSMKALLPDPWNEFVAQCRDGDILEGIVVSIQKFGAFLELAPGVEGLVHISQLADRRVSRPEEVVTTGQKVKVRIQSIDREQKRISLSMKAVEREARQAAEAQEIQDFRTKQEDSKGNEGPIADALRRAGLL
jgi:small subunit ribosomal protein S1